MNSFIRYVLINRLVTYILSNKSRSKFVNDSNTVRRRHRMRGRRRERERGREGGEEAITEAAEVE